MPTNNCAREKAVGGRISETQGAALVRGAVSARKQGKLGE